MIVAKIHVNNAIAHTVYRKVIPAGVIGAQVEFEYAEDVWSGLHKTVVFRGPVTKDVITDANIVTIPPEVAEKPLYPLRVGVYGVDADGNLAIPTIWADLGIARESAYPSGDSTTDPSLPVWAQIKQIADEAKQQAISVRNDADSGAFDGAPGHTPEYGVDYGTPEQIAGIAQSAAEILQQEVDQIKDDLVEYGKIFKRVNLFNKDKIHDGVINNQNTGSPYGSFTTLDGYFASELIEVIPGDKLFVWGAFDVPITSYVSFYSSEKKLVSFVNDIGVHTVVPENAVYFSVSSAKSKLETLMAYKEQPTEYYPYDYVRSNDDKVKCVKVNLFNGEFIRGYYCDKNLVKLNALENAVTSLPIVVNGETHVSYRNDGPEGFDLYFYGEDYNKISDVFCAKNTKGTIPVPENAFYIRFYALNELSDITIVYGDVVPERKYLPNEMSLCIKEVEDLKQSMSNYSNFLDGKKIVFDGDSITEGAGVTDVSQGIAPNNNKGYGYWIQQNHPTSICYGYAKSGWKVARRTDSNDSLLSHIEQYPADVDCFVLSGGYNDQATQVAIGEIVEPTDGNNAYFNATFDEYTFIGALESWFKQLRKNYPNAKIVYVLTPKRIYATNPVFNNDSKGDKVKDVIYSTGYERINLFWDSIKKVCKKWSVKYLDLSENCGIVGTGELTGDGLDVNKRYYKLDTDGNPDFTHPNTLFYKTFIVPQIEDLLKSVLD